METVMKFMLSVIAIAWFAGLSMTALAEDPRNNKLNKNDGVAGKIEASTEAATAKKVKMKDDMTADGKAKTEAMKTSSLQHVRQTRLHYSPPCPPSDPVAGMEACGPIHRG